MGAVLASSCCAEAVSVTTRAATHDVLRPTGRATGPTVQGLPSPALGHDFSGVPVLRREPFFPDQTCEDNARGARSNIERAWPTAKRWTSNARARVAKPTDVAGELGTHFKIDPNESAQAVDVAYVQRVFARMESIFDMQVPNFCRSPNVGGGCAEDDGVKYAAYSYSGLPLRGITHCIPSAGVGLLGGQELIETLVHEIAHTADPASTDNAYRDEAKVTTYAKMTRAQAIVNGDSYSEFARDLYLGGTPRSLPAVFSGGVGALLTARQPRWVVSAGVDVRSRTGLEIFDLVGGVRLFYEPQGDAVQRVGAVTLDIGVISRSPQTNFFVDTRVGAFIAEDPRTRPSGGLGVSANALIGWAKGGWRAGVDLRLLYDRLHDNNAAIIGVELGFNP